MASASGSPGMRPERQRQNCFRQFNDRPAVTKVLTEIAVKRGTLTPIGNKEITYVRTGIPKMPKAHG